MIYLKIHWVQLRVLVIGACIGLGTVQGFSQACCSGGAPVSGNLGLSTSDKGSLQFLATYDQNIMNSLMNGHKLLKDQSRTRATHSFLLETNYGLSERISISVLLSAVRQERLVNQLGTKEHITAQGPGDAILLAKYRVTSPYNEKFSWTIGAGPKIPLGSTAQTDSREIILPADMQPGTGALDAILWSHNRLSNLLGGRVTLMALNVYRYTGTNRDFIPNQDYRFGNEFQSILGGNYRIYVRRLPIDLQTLFNYRYVTADQSNGNDIDNTGGNWLFGVPGITLQFTDNLSWRWFGYIPLYRNLTGTQLTTSYRIATSIQFQFKKKTDSSSNEPL